MSLPEYSKRDLEICGKARGVWTKYMAQKRVFDTGLLSPTEQAELCQVVKNKVPDLEDLIQEYVDKYLY